MVTRTPTDPLYGSQWHFALLGDIETIWADYDGSGVDVAVYDDGIDSAHADLTANYDSSGHFASAVSGLTYDPNNTSSAHGTAVAGLIAADMDNVGGTGIASGASLTAVNFVGELQFESSPIVLEALAHAATFDIMNNSWGEAANYGLLYDGIGITPPSADPDPSGSIGDPDSRSFAWDGEYSLVAATGRGSLGTIIVQASGNDGSNAGAYGLNNSRYNITVGATDQQGAADIYSNWGTAVLVSAPAASVTTDVSGRHGVNTTDGAGGDYMTTFSGTSAATPIVSGVVALMLEANPGLGWRDVQNILAASASMTGSVYGNEALASEASSWASNSAGNWNGGGYSFNLSYGFGMVDAYSAVRMAESWTLFYDSPATSANEVSSTGNFANQAVAINDAVGTIPGTSISSVMVVENIAIENIQITVDVTHDMASDLVFWLVAPDGTEIPFIVQEGYPVTDLFSFPYTTVDYLMNDGFVWTYEVTAYLGMETAGLWSVRVEDHVENGSTGAINDVRLDFYGASITNDDVYHYTSDFLEMVAVDTERAALLDADGGVDWLNAVAVQGDILIDFVAAEMKVDDVHWTTLSGIESAATGDGDDTLTGDAADNAFFGGRGNDLLSGNVGADTLEGGRGNDSISGGIDADSLRGGHGGDTLSGGESADTILGGAGADSVLGGDGADNLNPGFGNDIVDGGAGNDTINTGDGADMVEGGDNDDSILSGDANDTIFGGLGNDVIDGQRGHDSIDGGLGNDAMKGFIGRDTMLGGEGFDSIDGGQGDDSIMGGGEDDEIFGGDGGDILLGGEGNDSIFTGLGADTAEGGSGDDALFGGAGRDLLRGGDGNDLLLGGIAADTLEGGSANDTLKGGGQADLIDGGIGDDELTGGEGADIFVFAEGYDSDTIMDFDLLSDRLLFDASLWGGGLDEQQVVDAFGTASLGNTTFEFGSGDVLILASISDEQDLVTLIDIA